LGMAGSMSFEEFRHRLTRAFPSQPFHGLISSHDECDEGIALRRELHGKRWGEVPAEFVDYNSGSLALLEPSALVAFLPAWLLRSMKALSDKSVLAEFTMYFLCPGHEDEGWDETSIAETVQLFDTAQRKVIGDFLRSIAESDTLGSWHAYAKHGLKWWSA
jgi:hypothetical protein